jgi:adenylate cyclase
LPFDNMGRRREDEFLADGIVEDITAALSRVRSFFVIARNSTLTYKGQAVNVQQASRELGVRYVLAGSVRRVRDRVRITAQLIDAVTAAHLWADHYDGIVQDVFELQDQITTNVVGAIEPSIRAAEIERARRKRPESLDAYDFVMQALPLVWSLDRLSNEKATRLLDDALDLDPAYPLALSLSAWCSGQRVVYDWSRDPDAEREEAIRKAQAAADLAGEDPFVLTVLGAALTITRQYRAGLLAVEKALALDPNSAWAWNRSGYLQIQFDRPDEAIDHFEKAIRLSPFDPLIFNSYFGIGMAHFVAGRYGDCVDWCEKALLANPKAIWINRTLAAAYAFTGRRKEAELSVRRLLDGYPGLTIPAVRSAQAWRPRVLDRISEGLKQAGLPE